MVSQNTYMLIVSLLLIASVMPVTAGVWQYTENYSSSFYKDGLNTSALWDTVPGEIRLPPYQLTNVGAHGTTSQSFGVHISGNYAYVGIGSGGVQVFNIANPASPSPVGAYNTPGFAWTVFISGNYAYVADRASGMIVLDISTPSSPTLAGSYGTPSDANDVVVYGDHAYVADRLSGLQIIDISDPTNPTLAGSVSTPGYAQKLQVSGDYAYMVCSFGGLQVVDVSDPTSPTIAGSHTTTQNAYGVSVAGDLLCVSVWAWDVQLFDISDPTTPTLLGSYAGGHNRQVTLSGNYAYVADGSYGVKVLDVSDPSTPVLSAVLDTPVDAEWLDVDGDHVFIADWSGGFRVMRISDPVPLRRMGGYDTAGFARNVAVSGDHAYIADGAQGLQIVSINSASSPTLSGTYDTPGVANSVAVWGDHAYVADDTAGLQVVDISDPTSPTLAGSYDTYGLALDVVVDGDHAYVADNNWGVLAVDISDPTAPDSVGGYNTGGNVSSMAVSGDHLFVASFDTALVVLDISTPSSPVFAGSYITPGSTSHLVVSGDYAYLAEGNAGLVVLDISDPTTPTLAGSYNTSGSAIRVAVSGDFAFVADMSGGVVLIDISNPASPSLLDSYVSPDDAYGVAASDNYIYVAGWSSGLHVIEAFQRSFDLNSNAARSKVLTTPAQIMGARMATTQLDSIRWELSANGGVNWTDVPHDDTWHPFPVSGDSLVWRSTHNYAGLGVNPSCSNLQITLKLDIPQVEAITDIPLDQGRQVSVEWMGSGHDFVGSSTPITGYAVYRQIDPDLAPVSAQMASGDGAQRLYPPGDWHYVTTVPARCEDSYAVVVPTLNDSTITEGMYRSTFFVSAMTASPGVYFDSFPDSGYSVDNLAPNVPQGMTVAYNTGSGNHLSWDAPPDNDFRYICIYRGATPDFTPAEGTRVGTTASTEWYDPEIDGWNVFYKITAVDFAGNESDASSLGSATGVPGAVVPDVFALHQNWPNPFNPTTAIDYDVPLRGGMVELKVYDVGGRLVRTLVNGFNTPGRKRVTWNGLSDRGVQVSSGVYFYRLTAGGFESTRKMNLLK